MTPSLRDLTLTSLKIGCLGFGGPAGQISLMHRTFVEEKRWIDEPRYLHALSFCTLLPGPEAQQLATYVGWLLRGTVGGLIAGTLFVLPGAAVVFALAWLYAAHGDVAPVAAAFGGVKAAVVALVAEALLRVGKRALKGRVEVAIAVAAFLALALFALPFPLVVLVAALIGATRGAPDAAADALPAPTGPGPGKRRTLAKVLVRLIRWPAPRGPGPPPRRGARSGARQGRFRDCSRTGVRCAPPKNRPSRQYSPAGAARPVGETPRNRLCRAAGVAPGRGWAPRHEVRGNLGASQSVRHPAYFRPGHRCADSLHRSNQTRRR